MDRGSDAGSQLGVDRNRLNSAAESTLWDGDCRTRILQFGCGDDGHARRQVYQPAQLSTGYTHYRRRAFGTKSSVLCLGASTAIPGEQLRVGRDYGCRASMGATTRKRGPPVTGRSRRGGPLWVCRQAYPPLNRSKIRNIDGANGRSSRLKVARPERDEECGPHIRSFGGHRLGLRPSRS